MKRVFLLSIMVAISRSTLLASNPAYNTSNNTLQESFDRGADHCNTLPAELLTIIFRHAGIESFYQLALVNKQFAGIIKTIYPKKELKHTQAIIEKLKAFSPNTTDLRLEHEKKKIAEFHHLFRSFMQQLSTNQIRYISLGKDIGKQFAQLAPLLGSTITFDLHDTVIPSKDDSSLSRRLRATFQANNILTSEYPVLYAYDWTPTEDTLGTEHINPNSKSVNEIVSLFQDNQRRFK